MPVDTNQVVASERQRIALVSGGTGGHLMPALALARAMPSHDFDPLLLIEGREVERELVRRELPDLEAHEVQRAGGTAGLPLWLGRTTMRARRLLRDKSVSAVLSTGGRASLPIALAAKQLRVPLFLLEQNAVVGRANRWLLPLARRMFTGLPASSPAAAKDVRKAARSTYTGTPLRAGFGHIEAGDARRSLGLAADVPVVLITGGSQGARALNECVPHAVLAAGRRVQVVHLSGLGNETAVRQRYAEVAHDTVATVRPVAADMDRLFAAADLVVCRGGGTTVAELMAVGRAAVILPYPHHKDRQQFWNARVLEQRGAAMVLEEGHADLAASLAAVLRDLLSSPDRLAAMGDAARTLRRLDAADAILRGMQEELRDGGPGKLGARWDRGLPRPREDARGGAA
ncbi:MAG: glycosyltransferase [Planctomycetota bacterium]